ncbi:hypothetical protein GCM10020256_60010 [Streptomyces thermocoprophilus]
MQALGAGVQTDLLDVVHRDGTEGGPGDVGEVGEDAVEVLAVRLDQAVGEQVQPQIDVVGVDRLLVEGGDDRADRDHLDTAAGVRADRPARAGAQQLGGPLRGEPLRAGRAGLLDQLGGREPGVEDGAVGGDRGEAGGDGAGGTRSSRVGHEGNLTGRAPPRPTRGPVSQEAGGTARRLSARRPG